MVSAVFIVVLDLALGLGKRRPGARLLVGGVRGRALLVACFDLGLCSGDRGTSAILVARQSCLGQRAYRERNPGNAGKQRITHETSPVVELTSKTRNHRRLFRRLHDLTWHRPRLKGRFVAPVLENNVQHLL
jgi:hypothetical protein